MAVPRRPRILCLSQTLPFPPNSGAKVRTYNVLRQLAREFDLYALCFVRSASVDRVHDIGEPLEDPSGNFVPCETFPIPQEWSRVRFAVDHGRSVLFRRPYVWYTYASGSYETRLRQLLREEQVDLVHADSLDLARYFPLVAHVPLVCVHHDVQSLLLARRAPHEQTWVRRVYARQQAHLMARLEAHWLPRVSLNVTVSSADRDHYARRAPGARIEVVPNGVDLEYFTPGPETGRDAALFVGGADWFPNRDAMNYLGREILPRIREQVPRARVVWVGWVDADARRLAREVGIEVTGRVPDVRPYLRQAVCSIVPVRIGGGTRIKILDAWAMGLAVVSTSIGCEGLQTEDGVNILIRDDPAAFAEAVVGLLRREITPPEIGKKARATVEQYYGWDRIGEDVRALYRALIPELPGRRVARTR